MQKIMWTLGFMDKSGLFGFRWICSQIISAKLKKSSYIILTVHKYFLLFIG